VDHPFREDKPVFAGKAPSLQLIGGGEATYLVLQAASEYRSRITAGKVFIPLSSRVSLILQIEVLHS